MSLPIGQRRLTPVVILSLVVVAALGKKARPTGSLQALYDFSRADCLAGSFGKSSGKSASLGAVAVAGSGSHCLEGVGLGMDGARPGTAAASTGTISDALPAITSSGAYSLEVWVRAAPQPSDASLPILAIGTEGAFQDSSPCDKDLFGVALMQRGNKVEVQLASSSYSSRADSYNCIVIGPELHAGSSDFITATAADLGPPVQIMVVVQTGKPAKVYHNGKPVAGLIDALSAQQSDVSSYALQPQFDMWSDAYKLLLGPVPYTKGAKVGWDGELLLVAMHSSALTAAQVQDSYSAWLADSAPLAGELALTTMEDTPFLITLNGTDPFDAKYNPTGASKLSYTVTKLPAPEHGFLIAGHAGAKVPPSGATPLTGPTKLSSASLWFTPYPDLFGTAAATFEYQVSDSKGGASEEAAVTIDITPVNDAPRPTAAEEIATTSASSSLTLQATDVDSKIAHAVLLHAPEKGTLSVKGTELKVGDTIPWDEAAGGAKVDYEYGGEGDDDKAAQGAQFLDEDSFTFGACDEEGECSKEEDGAEVTIKIKNGLQADPISSTMAEDTALLITLTGGRTTGEGGGTEAAPDLFFAVVTPPTSGALYHCVPPQGGSTPCGGTKACPCCMPDDCGLTPLAAADAVRDATGRVLYQPDGDYFNCPTKAKECSAAVAVGESASFVYEVRDADSRRSPPATAEVWVKNEPDYPHLRGPREFDAEVFQEVRLPAGLEIGDPDQDLEKWGVTISTGAEYGGFVYLNDKIRADPDKLKYIMGDGRSKFTSFTAYPSAAGGAIVGAKYMSLGKDAEAYNDTISIIVQDPATKYILPPCPDGFVTLTKDDVVGLDKPVCGWQIHVNSLPPSESQFTDAAANLPISSLIATWSLIGAVLLWFGWQLYGWLWNVCNPEDVETRAAERYEVLVQKREAKMRGSISPDLGMGGGGLPTTGKQARSRRE
mmetsp:Transcript_8431/g.26427  ORF Transcript_8431/g.26427 Transcript_8431/m.26427 type:complete len:945 (-) Transcript_8431:621-3455(-)